jgi:hypothetical protein
LWGEDFVRTVFFLVVAFAFSRAAAGAADVPSAADRAIPRYKHIFVIMDENKDFSSIDQGADAPVLMRLARTYGYATRFYGETHPSEGNYVALLGGSTFGIRDDDAYYCMPGSIRPACGHASELGYAPHAIYASHLGTQLDAVGLTWKGYYQSIPAPGSDAVESSYYAAKHSGFMNFASVQRDPSRAAHIVGFDAFRQDVTSNKLPSFGLIVPDLCDDMHGLRAAPGVPEDCRVNNPSALIRRGDAMVGRIVNAIMEGASWRSAENVAIVVTFDEAGADSAFGGGHIATVVMTNHGPRGVSDATRYNHYALLRTIEDAFGIYEYLGSAAVSEQGGVPMSPLFSVR